MKKRVSIEIEEMITETRIVLPGNIYCQACGALISISRSDTGQLRFDRPRVETTFIKPENLKLLDPAKE